METSFVSESRRRFHATSDAQTSAATRQYSGEAWRKTRGLFGKIERLDVPGLAQYSYVISVGGGAVAIDPVRAVKRTGGLAAWTRAGLPIA